VLPEEGRRIAADAKILSSLTHDRSHKLLLYGAELVGLDELSGIAISVEKATGVRILTLPVKTRELDEEVDRRMSRARVLRK
jgi:hypothetical protein